MINLEIIEFFSKGVRPSGVLYTQEYSVNLPTKGPATIDLKDERSDGSYPTRTIELPFPVNQVEVPSNFTQAYTKERQLRKSPNSRFPNELIANLRMFRLDSDGVLRWSENLTDWSVLGGGERRGILRGGLLYNSPDDERKRISREFAPSAPLSVVESSDGYIIVGARGEQFHLAGQIMPFPVKHPVYNPATKSLESPWIALERALQRELGYQLEDAKDVYVVGAVRGNHGSFGSWNPAIPYIVQTSLTIKELEELHKTAPDRPENRIFIPVNVDSQYLAGFVKDNVAERIGNDRRHKMIDNGLGILLLYGRHRLGDSWYEQLVHDLTADPRYETTITEGNPFR